MAIGRRAVGAGVSAAMAGAALAQSPARPLALRATPVASGLDSPWSIAFLPDGGMLVTERPGRLRRLSPGGGIVTIEGTPAVWARGQGGLLDVCVHPDFGANQLIYLSYAGTSPEGAATRIARARLIGDRLVDVATIFEAGPRIANNFHFGGRLAFGRDRRLYATTGDRMAWRDEAQNLGDLRGKIVRLADDGSVPPDNPFVGRAGTRGEIYTYGHRNPQGLAMHPTTGAMWAHEHGPRGGDEVNILAGAGNFGWPKATHGVDYSGAVISEHKSLPGMIDPRWVWVPSIAPSGMAFCTAAVYPGWRGSLVVGALAARLLVRLELDGDRVVREERLLQREVGRIRDVREGPDGKIYIAIDSNEGGILRLDPV